MISKNIKKFREAKNITQNELAEKLCVTRQAVSNWERAKTEPDIDMLNRLADTLEVSIEELIYGEKKKNKKLHVAFVSSKERVVGDSVTLGTVIAAVISYVQWKSIGWAVLHGIFGWGYVIYYIIKYGWS